MLYRFQQLPIDQAFPGREYTEKDEFSSRSTNGLDRTKEFHCNTFHCFAIARGAGLLVPRWRCIRNMVSLHISFRVGFIRDTREEE